MIGQADLDRPTSFESGRLYYPYGGGPFLLEPFRCAVRTSEAGKVELHLELLRALRSEDARATLSYTIEAEYETDAALDLVRESTAARTVTPMALTDWWLRVPSPPSSGGHIALTDLAEPTALASNGLGMAQMVQTLSVESALTLEEMLKGDASLEGVAEVGLAGVSPRLPVVARFAAAGLLEALLDLGDDEGAMPRRFIVDYFQRDASTLPIGVEGVVDVGSRSRFAEAMTDRVVARFGRYIRPQDLSDMPVVRLDRPTGDISIIWSLSQAFLAERRLVLPVDLLSAAQRQIEELGPESVIRRRDLTALPPLGHERITALANLPVSREGVEALGVSLTFPPRPPKRPQARTVTAEFEPPEDTATLDVMLSPGEPRRYEYTTFAVLSGDGGVRQLDGPESYGTDPILHLSPADFPIDIATIEITPALAGLAAVMGTCTYELADGSSATPFVLDIDRRSIGIAIPRDRVGLSIEATAVALDGSGALRIAPFDSPGVRLDVTSFATYGPQRIDIRCVFDDRANGRAIQVQPIGSDDADDITSLSFTLSEPTATYAWHAASPFASGFRYRPFGGDDRSWMEVVSGREELTLFSSQLQDLEAVRAVAARSAPVLREIARHETVRHLEAEPVTTEAAVEPVGVSPLQEPTDEMLYTRVADATRKLYLPRYVLDLRTVSGKQRYRIAMTQSEATSSLEVNLVAVPAPAIAEPARDAEEYPHTVGLFLDFLVAADSTLRKRLEFTDVTRNGAILTASVAFATLAERDDVYRAMTEPVRQCRLIVRRTFDVSVPNETHPPPPPTDGIPDFTLPWRPAVEWPPARRFVGTPIVDKPIEWTYPPEPDPRPMVTTVRQPALVNTVAAVDASGVFDAGVLTRSVARREADRLVSARLATADDVVLRARRFPVDGIVVRPRFPIPEPTIPPFRSVRSELEQVLEPDPFVFPPALHGYMFAGLTPASGSNQLVRYREQWQGTFHTYLQDASRPYVVYVFPDSFKIARRRGAPFTPFATVRVTTRPDGEDTDVVFDYVVAPFTDANRLNDASEKLLADPRFEADRIEFQPLFSSDVRFFIDRPTESGSTQEARPSASLVLQGALKDTLTMTLGDFRLLFDAMYSRTASLFIGRVEIDVPDEDTEVIPFGARMDDLQGELFSYEASAGTNGALAVLVRNEIESPVSIPTLDATIVNGNARTPGVILGDELPLDRLLPGETVRLTVAPQTALASIDGAWVELGLGGVLIIPDPAAIWDVILDRTTVEFYRIVTVKAIATLFQPVAGREDEQILHILVAFVGGDTADLSESNLEAPVRIDHPIDDVILGRPVGTSYRYTVTVIRANGQQQVDPEPRQGSFDLFFVSVTK